MPLIPPRGDDSPPQDPSFPHQGDDDTRHTKQPYQQHNIVDSNVANSISTNMPSDLGAHTDRPKKNSGLIGASIIGVAAVILIGVLGWTITQGSSSTSTSLSVVPPPDPSQYLQQETSTEPAPEADIPPRPGVQMMLPLEPDAGYVDANEELKHMNVDRTPPVVYM